MKAQPEHRTACSELRLAWRRPEVLASELTTAEALALGCRQLACRQGVHSTRHCRVDQQGVSGGQGATVCCAAASTRVQAVEAVSTVSSRRQAHSQCPCHPGRTPRSRGWRRTWPGRPPPQSASWGRSRSHRSRSARHQVGGRGGGVEHCRCYLCRGAGQMRHASAPAPAAPSLHLGEGLALAGDVLALDVNVVQDLRGDAPFERQRASDPVTPQPCAPRRRSWVKLAGAGLLTLYLRGWAATLAARATRRKITRNIMVILSELRVLLVLGEDVGKQTSHDVSTVA